MEALSISAAFSRLTNLESLTLNLRKNMIPENGISSILLALGNLTGLKYLDLNLASNKIGE